MYLSPTDKYWAIDIEGNDLLPHVSVIHCAVAMNIKTNETVRMVGHDEIRTWFAARNAEECIFIGHNIIGYDAPTLSKILDIGIPINRLIDTMLLSMVYNPSLAGGHSLADWGARLKKPKTDFHEFEVYTPEMLDYCEQDTLICRLAYLALVGKLKLAEFSELSIKIEHISWHLVKIQQKNGFYFNIEQAHVLLAKLNETVNELTEKIHEFWPPTLELVCTYRKPYKKDGTLSANCQRHIDNFVKVDIRKKDDEYDCWDYVAFNPGSPPQRVQKLLELGWEPEEFTKPSKTHPNGQPQVTKKGNLVPSLVRFIEEDGHEEIKLLAKWIDVKSRLNMINNWIEEYNDDTHCLHGTLWLANTFRYRHSNPNTANIPAVRLGADDAPLLGEQGVWTYEARDLWTVRGSDRVLVGVDAAGIQLRVLAHYLNNDKFTEAILSADPHAANRDAWGFSADKAGRSLAKTIVYATLMGAGDKRIQLEAKLETLQDAKDAKALFLDRVPEFPALIARLEGELSRTGRITLCDGARIIVSSPHMVIPYLLQGDESRIMKVAAFMSDAEIRKRKLDVLKVGDIHDEWQNDVYKPHSEELRTEVFPSAFANAGKFFKYNLPIECDSEEGMTWAETH